MKVRAVYRRYGGRFWMHDSGAVATEYAFIIAFISIVAATGMSLMGISLSGFYSTIGSSLAEASCSMPDNASDNGKNNSNKCK